MKINEIREYILKVKKEVNEDKEALQKAMENKGFSCVLNEQDAITKRLRKKFKHMILKDIYFQWDSRFKAETPLYEDLAKSIYYAKENKEELFLNKIGFISMNEKNETITLRHSELYYFRLLKEVFNIDYEKEIIKEYQNGKSIIKFKDSDTFKVFAEIVKFTNYETEAIIKAINEQDLKEYQEIIKGKYGNKYNIIHTIKKRLELKNWIRENSYLIFKELDERLKK